MLRHTMPTRLHSIPFTVEDRLKQHLVEVKARREIDLSEGSGYVTLPNRLERKYPNADRQWIWQWVFPAMRQ